MRRITREGIVKAATKAAAKCKGTLTLREFHRQVGITSTQVYYHFPEGWYEVLRAAGLTDRASRCQHIMSHALMEELHGVATSLGRLPTLNELRQRTRYSVPRYQHRFGSLCEIRAAYKRWCQKHAAKGSVATDSAARETEATQDRVAASSKGTDRDQRAQVLRSDDPNAFGRPLAFKGIANEPVNEMGVVHLFGAVCADLGFVVQRVCQTFPDCVALRRGDRGLWGSVRIEFEFRSASFLKHGHEISKCDLIVCWEDDWKGCPIEVIELRKEVERMRRAG